MSTLLEVNKGIHTFTLFVGGHNNVAQPLFSQSTNDLQWALKTNGTYLHALPVYVSFSALAIDGAAPLQVALPEGPNFISAE